MPALWGDWAEAEALAAAVGGDPAESVATGSALYAREFAAWNQGHLDEARALLDLFPTTTNPRGAASVELSRIQIDLAQGVDSGAVGRLEVLLVEARRRGFSGAVAELGWAPGTWRMVHGEPEAGALDVVAWRDEVEAPWGIFSLRALLTLGRVVEARAEIEAERAVFWGAEAQAMRGRSTRSSAAWRAILRPPSSSRTAH